MQGACDEGAHEQPLETPSVLCLSTLSLTHLVRDLRELHSTRRHVYVLCFKTLQYALHASSYERALLLDLENFSRDLRHAHSTRHPSASPTLRP
jgi:hypothetical protein